MTKKSNKLFILIALVLLVALTLTLVACNPDEEPGGKGVDKITLTPQEGKYVVGVYYEDGTPVKGAVVQLCVVEADGQLGTCYVPNEDGNVNTIGDSGYVVLNYAEDYMEVHILAGMPDGYELAKDSVDVRMHKGETAKLVVVQQEVDPATLYTVKLTLPDGTPAANRVLRLIAVDDPNDITVAFTDAKGVAQVQVKSGKDVHVEYFGNDYAAPSDLSTKVLKAGETLEIKLADLTISQPTGGTGKAEYKNADRQLLDSSRFSPYKIKQGNYKFKFDDADECIYIEFHSNTRKNGMYRIYSRGSVDASVQQLAGNPMLGGLFNPGKNGTDEGRPQYNDNISEQDKNFSLDVAINEGVTGGGNEEGVLYFELELKDPDQVNVEFILSVEYTGEYVPPKPIEWTEVHAEETLSQAEKPSGSFHSYMPLDASNFVVVFNEADGYYHLGSQNGAVLYANLKGPWPYGAVGEGDMPLTFTLRNSYGNVYEWSFDGVTGENWLPLLQEYIAVCNSDGYYPVTKELARFLTLVYNDSTVQGLYFTSGNMCNITWRLPEGYEWIFICGYYGEEYTGPQFSGGNGTQADPYVIYKTGAHSVEFESGQTLYFKSDMFIEVASSSSAKLLCDGKEYGGADGFRVSVSAGKQFAIRYDGSAASEITFTVSYGVDGSGKEDDPYMPAAIEGEYSYNIPANDKLYFAFAASQNEEVFTFLAKAGYENVHIVMQSDEDEPQKVLDIEGKQSEDFTLEAYTSYILILENKSAESVAFEWEMTLKEVHSAQTLPQGGVNEDEPTIVSFEALLGEQTISMFATDGVIADQWLSFTAPKGKTLVFKPASGLTVAISYEGANAAMYSLSSDEPGTKDFGSVAADGTVTLPLIEGKTYKLQFHASSESNYTVNFVAQEGGAQGGEALPGSSMDNAITVTLDELLALSSVQISNAGVPVYYKIIVTEEVTLTVTSNTQGAIILFESRGLASEEVDEDYYSLGNSDANKDLNGFVLHTGCEYIITFNLNGESSGTVSFSVTKG